VPTTFKGGAVWDAITTACHTRGPRVAAIAYVSTAAPALVPLKRGDILVCNAGDEALLTHATSPVALAEFIDRGVEVWSSPRLHAKVVATATHAVIGSANASDSSTTREEAVVVTTDRAVRAAVHRFVDDLDADPVDGLFIDAARQTYARGKSWGRDGAIAADTGLIPAQPRLRVVEVDWFEPTDAEEEIFRRTGRQLRRKAGPAATYELDSFYNPPGAPPYRLHEVLLGNDDEMLHPPEVVISDPLRASRQRRTFQIIRRRVGLEPIPLEKAQAELRAAGVSTSLRERQIRDPATRAALLALWPELTDSVRVR
jgi:hypothetical protein